MKERLIIVLVLCTVTTSYAFLENMEEYIREVESDPVKNHLAVFNEYAVRCFGEARKNQSKLRMSETQSVCCFQDYWLTCMEALPLIKECSSITEDQLRRFEADIISGFDCTLVDLRGCTHTSGSGAFVSQNRERSARFTSTASSNAASIVAVVITAYVALIGRML